jgi:hypothetical protein
MPVLAQLGTSDRVDAAVYGVQAPGFDSMGDCRPGKPSRKKLLPSDDPVLTLDQAPNLTI